MGLVLRSLWLRSFGLRSRSAWFCRLWGFWLCCGARFGRLRRFLRLDGNQFDVEDQRGAWADVRTRTSVTVCKVRRDKQLVLGTNRHQLQGLSPTLDYAGDWEGSGAAVLGGAVEFLA